MAEIHRCKGRLGWLGALAAGGLHALACEDSVPNFFAAPDAGALAGLGGQGGSGAAGSGGMGQGGTGAGDRAAGGTGAGAAGAQQGGSAGMAGSAPDAGAGAACSTDAECEEQDACLSARCEGGVCVMAGFKPAGTPCGDAKDDECANPDVCGGNGLCLANDEANGTACSGGSCTLSACVPGQPVGCPAEVAGDVPFTTSWSSVGRPDLYVGGCDSLGTPDYALVFTAPASATFRFVATALVDETPYTGADQTDPFSEPPDGDAVLTVVEGGCAGGAATQVACSDDSAEDNRDSLLELPLISGQVVTLYLNELTQSGGGTGTLTITQLP